MDSAIYILGTLICLLCAILLLRAYRATKKRLLFWSGLCFAGLTVSNGLVFVDLIVYPEVDLFRFRLIAAAVAMCMLLYGLIWRSD